MYKPSTYFSNYLFSYLFTYIYETLFLTELVTKVKPNINPDEVHPQLSNNAHPLDGVLVGAASLWRTQLLIHHNKKVTKVRPW